MFVNEAWDLLQKTEQNIDTEEMKYDQTLAKIIIYFRWKQWKCLRRILQHKSIVGLAHAKQHQPSSFEQLQLPQRKFQQFKHWKHGDFNQQLQGPET